MRVEDLYLLYEHAHATRWIDVEMLINVYKSLVVVVVVIVVCSKIPFWVCWRNLAWPFVEWELTMLRTYIKNVNERKDDGARWKPGANIIDEDFMI